ncbi:DEK-C domain-containing protein [Pleurotus pulmonarius]
MASPNPEDIAAAVKHIIQEAKESDTLSQITPRIVRQEVERKLELHPGSLDGSKKHIKETIGHVMSELNKPEAENDASSEPKPDIPSSPAEKLKKRRPVDNEGERNVKPKKRKSNDSEKPSRDSSRKPPTKKFKSSEMIPTSDAEPDEPAEIDTKEVASSNGKPKVVQNETNSTPHAASTSKPSSSKSPIVANVKEDKSDSELSVLMDEPKRKRVPKKDKDVAPAKAKGKRKPAPELSKAEETIKRLKSLVVACGISKLQQILADLGMEGRLSLEKAKAIKEKREFEKELADVKAFEKTMAARSAPPKSASESGAEDDERADSDSDTAIPKRRKPNARASIMAFLADQSDDE